MAAVEAMKESDFDLIMLDWNMPKIQGLDALKAIRASGNTTPVMMVTGSKERTQVMEAFEGGANDYIIKPSLPSTVGERIHKTLTRASDAASRQHTRKALIADDSAVLRKILQSVLTEHLDFSKILQAADGAEAVALINEHDFDLIFLDWNMPEILGIDVLREIRSTGVTTPAIMVTNEKEGARVVEAFDAGANNYIIKPFAPATSVEKIKQVISVQ